MDHGALDDAVEAGRRLGVLPAVRHEVFKLPIDVVAQVLLEEVEIDRAGAQDRRRLGVVGQAQQKMLERRIFVVALVGDRERPMQRLFEVPGE